MGFSRVRRRAASGRRCAAVIKQAVATGWDCPRAHILVKLRENMDERFEIQMIDRIRRMPEARRMDIQERGQGGHIIRVRNVV